MRNCFSFFLLLLLSSGAFSQSVTSITPNQTNLGQNLNVSISGMGGFSSATAVYLQNGSNTIQASSFTIQSATQLTASFSIPASTTYAGQYDVHVQPFVVELPNGFLVNNVGGGNNQAYITGAAYHDANTNCAYDTGESVLVNQIVTVEPGGYVASTNSNGAFGLWVPTGSYTVFPPTGPSLGPSCPDSSNVNATFAGLTYPAGALGVTAAPGADLVSVTIVGNPARPGFSHTISASVTNHSLLSAQGTLGVFIDTLLTFSSSNVPPLFVSNDTMFFAYSLAPQQKFKVGFLTTVPTIPTVSLGQQLCNFAFVNDSLDGDPSNNEWLGCYSITGSYDPNDKRIISPGAIGDSSGTIRPEDSLLTYMIRFQNTGTDTAFNIVVRDTLQGNLQPSTLRMEQASHDYLFNMGSSGECEWLFPDILLPDSNTNEPLSHGYLVFTIKRVEGLGIGDSVWNTASIYFDYNPAVVTNRQVHVIDTVVPLSLVPDLQADEYPIAYPVPAGEKLWLDWGDLPPNAGELWLLDPQGRELKRVRFSGVLPRSLDMEDVHSGVFFLRLETATGIRTKKIIKR